MPTGGFSTEARSIEAFGAATQWVIVGFMVAAGMNFALLYRGLVRRQPRALVRDEELRLYVTLLLAGSALLLAELWTEGVIRGEEAVRVGTFQVVSLMTTTGYASADFNLWPVFAAIVLIAVMFFGGSAGSTSGSVKVVRHLLIGRILRRELDQSVVDGLAAAATTIGNVGPALGFAGPMGSFDPFSGASKLVMILLMWLGRLEIIPVAVLFSRHYWRV